MKSKKYQVLVVSAVLMMAFIITSSFNSNISGHKYATMIVREAPAGYPDNGYGSQILIVYEDSKTEEIPLEKLKANTYVANRIKINEALNSMATKGYELISADEFTYVFVKK